MYIHIVLPIDTISSESVDQFKARYYRDGRKMHLTFPGLQWTNGINVKAKRVCTLLRTYLYSMYVCMYVRTYVCT